MCAQSDRPHSEAGVAAELAAVREVLRAISSAPFDLALVLGIACEHAVRLTNAEFGYVHIPEGGFLRLVGTARAPDEMLAYMREHPIPIDRRTTTGRVVLTGSEQQIPDVFADPEWDFRDGQRLGGYRSTLSVPLRKEGQVIGVFSLSRRQAGSFSEHELELVRTFADQAAIIVENVRLLTTVERQREELAHYLPATVAELVSSPQESPLLAAHRREITAVFCDLRNFTSFTAGAEPEEVLDVLGDYQRELGQIVLAHGGTLEHYAGDGIMSFLNDPKPVPNHSLEAIAMALEMQEKFATLASRWGRSGFDLGLGIGLSTGYATVGRVGFEGYYLYAAIGSVPNLAARLCAVAKAGQTVISGRTYAKVEADVEAERLGSFDLKGFSQPVEAYSVTAVGVMSK
jgi:class 3 adenylate cyclase